MTDWIDKALERLAMACTNLPQNPASGYLRDVRELLQCELGPLLEAGQRERDRHIGDYESAFDVRWDAAKKKLEGKP